MATAQNGPPGRSGTIPRVYGRCLPDEPNTGAGTELVLTRIVGDGRMLRAGRHRELQRPDPQDRNFQHTDDQNERDGQQTELLAVQPRTP